MKLIAFGILMALLGCESSQQGQFVVTGSSGERLTPGFVHIDKYYGTPNPIPSNAKDQLLLAFITVQPNFEPNATDSSKENGPYVSVGRTAFQSAGNSTLTYGMIWNRTDDKLAIGSKEFDRRDGNVFVVIGPNAPEPKYIQIPTIVETLETNAIIETVIQNCPLDCEACDLLRPTLKGE
ncbi:MAG: hypothetical protein MUC43_16935 [Pirellula sp.]|jgi:hypothetical protein|nr:hypothetical protein [Pirellula sp.]